MKVTFLGTGTSYGVPYIGCDCEVCHSPDPRNKRLRSSILIEETVDGETTRLLIDTTPDLRQQLLRAGVSQISAILWTHDHNDHIIGLDDIRPITDRTGYIDGYAAADTLGRLTGIFDYIFQQGRTHGGFPRITPHVIEPLQSFCIGPFTITPLTIWHGKREILAYRFESSGHAFVYATDCSMIPDETLKAMQHIDTLIIDGLRHKPHPTHFNVEQAVATSQQLQPRRTYLTHIAHDLEHEATNRQLPTGIEMAYDTLEIAVGG